MKNENPEPPHSLAANQSLSNANPSAPLPRSRSLAAASHRRSPRRRPAAAQQEGISSPLLHSTKEDSLLRDGRRPAPPSPRGLTPTGRRGRRSGGGGDQVGPDVRGRGGGAGEEGGAWVVGVEPWVDGCGGGVILPADHRRHHGGALAGPPRPLRRPRLHRRRLRPRLRPRGDADRHGGHRVRGDGEDGHGVREGVHHHPLHAVRLRLDQRQAAPLLAARLPLSGSSIKLGQC